jgi:hypothetical protein
MLMRQTATRAALVAVFLAASVLAHGDESTNTNTNMDMDMDMNTSMNKPASAEPAHPNSEGPMSYFAYDKHRGAILAHISLMIAAWCLLLPTCKCQHG